jgi:TolA-binding protein
MTWTRVTALMLLLLAGACSPVTRQAIPQDPAALLVARASELAARGQREEALALYHRVVRDYPGDPAAAAALHGLGRLLVEARSYRAAYAAYSSLATDHPRSRWASEAWLWRTVLGDLLTSQGETARLKTQIDRLRRTDLDLEQRR